MTETAQSNLTRFNLIASGLLIGLGLLAVFWLIPNYIPVRSDQAYGLTAAFMPQLSAITVMVLAALHAAKTIWHLKRYGKTLDEDSEDNEHLHFGGTEGVNLVLFGLGAGAYVALLGELGFVVASTLALALMLFLGGVRNPLRLLPLALGVPVAVDQILWYALTIRLPVFPYWP